MSQDESVSRWIHSLKAGAEGEAQQKLWNHYFERLTRLARSHLSKDLCRVEDEEDVALSVLGSFFDRVQAGQFPELNDRTSLWPLLVTITICKTKNLQRRHCAQKRDARRVVSFLPSDAADGVFDPFVDSEPTPEIAVEAAEQATRLIAMLEKESLQIVARMKLDGYTNREIAEKVGVMERTIERRLALIRQTWTELADIEADNDS